MKDAKSGREICEAEVADTFWKRLLGLMFRRKMAEGSGLLIELPGGRKNCAVHTLFMSFPIDLVFLDLNKKVVDVKTLVPWRYYDPKRECGWILELVEGRIKELDLHPGDELILEGR